MHDLQKLFFWLYVGIMKSLHKTLLKYQLPTPDLLPLGTASPQPQTFKIMKSSKGVCACVRVGFYDSELAEGIFFCLYKSINLVLIQKISSSIFFSLNMKK